MLKGTNPKPTGLLMIFPDILGIDLVIKRDAKLDGGVIKYTK